MNLSTEVRNSFTLGQVIQQGRLQQNLSQRDLASMLGISQKWVWEMEQGKPGILMDRLFKVLAATGVTLHAEFEVREQTES
jgi:transcriptional regulator with XRE-family HTH domain